MSIMASFLRKDNDLTHTLAQVGNIELRIDGITDPLALSHLNMERNSRVPIIRLLPEDVFIEIMLALQTTFNDLDNNSIVKILKNDPERMLAGLMKDYLEDWDWSVVTHVCHYWRKLAINCPRLWTKINTATLSSVDMTKAYLKRSIDTDHRLAEDLSSRHRPRLTHPCRTPSSNRWVHVSSFRQFLCAVTE